MEENGSNSLMPAANQPFSVAVEIRMCDTSFGDQVLQKTVSTCGMGATLGEALRASVDRAVEEMVARPRKGP